MNELEAFAILSSFQGIGAIKIRQLLEHFGSALDALKAPASSIAALPAFARYASQWDNWKTNGELFANLDLVNRLHAQIIPFNHSDFPKALLDVPDHPALLYMRGTLKPQDQRCIAVIGTRHSSIYGNEMAEQISADLAAHGYTVVSGLARGIDTAAHRGALKTGRTLAVIGSGLANVYPPENAHLAEAICHNGALLSEFSMTTPPDKQNFPQRNRIVAGMVQGVLLVEAPVRSGAMITMEKAWQYHRKLFVLPGRVDSENFRGGHALIKSGRGLLVEDAADVMAHFETFFPMEKKHIFEQSALLDEEERNFLHMMPDAETPIDELAQFASLPIQQVNRILMSLILKSVVKEFPGKIYKKTAAGNKLKRHN